jgi:hypothetical protein
VGGGRHPFTRGSGGVRSDSPGATPLSGRGADVRSRCGGGAGRIIPIPDGGDVVTGRIDADGDDEAWDGDEVLNEVALALTYLRRRASS